MAIEADQISNLMEKEAKKFASGDYDAASEKDGKKKNENNKFLGLVELPPELLSAANMAYGYVQPYIREGMEKPIREHGSKFFGKLGAGSRAGKMAGVAADTAGWAYTFYKPAQGSLNAVQKLMVARKELVDDLSPVLKTEDLKHSYHSLHQGMLNGNEIVQVEEKRMHKRLGFDFKRDVLAETASVIPLAKVKMDDDHARKAKEAAQKAGGVVPGEKPSMDKLIDLDKKMADEKGISLQDAREYRQSTESGHLAGAEKSKTYDVFKQVGPGAGALVAEMIKTPIRQKEREDKLVGDNVETALDRITRIYDEAQDTGRLSKIDGVPLKEYLKETFQVHQENMEEKRVGERWDKEFDYAVSKIANALERGKMHPMALVEIIGKREIVKQGGKSIANRGEVKAVVNRMEDKMPAKFSVEAEFYLSELAYGEEELKDIMEHIHGDAHDFLVHIIPDEVLMKVGMKEDDIKTSCANVKGHFEEMLRDVVLDFASMPDAKFKEAKLQEKEIKLIRDMGKKAKAGDMSSVVAAISTHGKFQDGVEWPLVNMKSYWQDVATGKRHIGDEYHAAGEMLETERQEAEEQRRAEERERKAQERKEAEEARKAEEAEKEKASADGAEKDDKPKKLRDYSSKDEEEVEGEKGSSFADKVQSKKDRDSKEDRHDQAWHKDEDAKEFKDKLGADSSIRYPLSKQGAAKDSNADMLGADPREPKDIPAHHVTSPHHLGGQDIALSGLSA